MASNRLMLVVFLLCSSCLASSPVSARKVSLALYYETLCPYCSNFIVNYLAKIFENGLIDVVDLELIPYGNAKVGSNGTITCQHGPYECVLNTVEACAISAWPDVEVHFSFINCVESLVLEHQYLEWKSCFSKTGLDSHAVLDCYEGGYGEKLELQYAAQTDSLQPPHTYVPWVVVDGEPLYDDYENFEAYICKAYSGELPNACAGLSLKISPGKKTNQVCYIDKMTSSAMTKKNDENRNNSLDVHCDFI